MSTPTRVIIPFLLAAAAACTVKETLPPPLAGPSELALRLALQAIPDSILQDGFSQTVINIDASGVDGRPVRGVPLRLEIIFQGITQDFGTLSAKTVVTGDDGRARVIYTAPPRPALAVENFNVITIFVTPIGNDFRGEVSRTVDIRLVTPGVIIPPPPPNEAPVARFTFAPAAPTAFSLVTFDASTSTDEGATLCGAACTYSWDFGDSTSATGIFTSHTYRTVGNYQVRLTVTDASGLTNQTAQTVSVGASAAPSAAFTFAPAAPAAGQTIFFSATTSTAVPPRRIVSYEWDFGTDRTASGVTVSKGYELPGVYPVTLTVTDDAGQSNSVTRDVTVSTVGALSAVLTVSPGTGNTSTNFFFDASASVRGPNPIIEYRFTFGDGTPDVVGTSPTTTHRYSLSAGYTARVTIRDSAGRTATATVGVTVQ